jgi:hypothetical protein
MDEPIPEIPPSLWLKRRGTTPIDHTFVTIDWVCKWFDRYREKLGKGGGWFRSAFNDALHSPDDPYDPDYFFDLASHGEGGKLMMANQITAIIACCVAARAAHVLDDERVAWTYASDARQIAMIMMQLFSDTFDASTVQARRAARAMLAKDPRQAAKREAKKLWQERRAGKHPRLRTNSQFAIECMRRWPVLKSHDVITGWCTTWTKEAKQKSQPAS